MSKTQAYAGAVEGQTYDHDTIRVRLRATIPTAHKALHTARDHVNHIAKTPPNQRNVTAMKIVNAGDPVITVIHDIADMHEVVLSASMCYASILKVEMGRRDPSNQQIATICYKMSSVVFLLRHLSPDKVARQLDESLKERLVMLLDSLKETMQEFGQHAELCYKEKSALAVIRGNELSASLRKLWERFLHHETELIEFFSIELPNSDINEGEAGYNIDIDGILQLIGQSTNRERRATQFINAQGGISAISGDARKFNELSSILGEKINRNLLQQGLSYLLDENRKYFDFKIDDAKEQIKTELQDSRDTILRRLDAGPHELLKDPELRQIWGDNRWRSSVESRVFMDGIHDYFEPQIREQIRKDASHPDHWTLPFLSKSMYYPAIADAIDDDGSGYISIYECNEFMKRRPEGWSTPKWLSFWAMVWLMNNEVYVDKVEGIINEINKAARRVKERNKEAMLNYQNNLNCIKPMILQSINWGINENSANFVNYSELSSIQDEYMKLEESRLTEQLVKVGYDLDDIDLLPSITGQDRVELTIMPLLYLVLKHQLAEVQRASEEVMEDPYYTFDSFSESIETILFAFDCRLDDLVRGWKQSRMDVSIHVVCFAGGMFDQWNDSRDNPSTKQLKHLRNKWLGDDDGDDYDDDGTVLDEDHNEPTTDDRVRIMESKIGRLEMLLTLVAQKLDIDVTVATTGDGSTRNNNARIDRSANVKSSDLDNTGEIDMTGQLNAGTDDDGNDYTKKEYGIAMSFVNDDTENARKIGYVDDSDTNDGLQNAEEPTEVQSEENEGHSNIRDYADLEGSGEFDD